MVKFKVITDSSAGFSKEDAEKYNVIVLPLTLSYDNKDYRDGIDITTDEFYNMFFENQEKKGLAKLDVFGLFKKDDKGFPKTSMVTPAVFEDTFKEVLKDGYVPVVLPISKVLSGTFQSANIAKDEFEDDIIVVEDSATALGSVKVFIKALCSKEYETIDDLRAEIDYLRKHINFYAVPETLAYLSKGGRLGKFSATVGNLLHFKPIIQLDTDGKLIPIEKPRGLKQAYRRVNEYLDINPIDWSRPVEFGYSTKPENVEQLIEACKPHLTGEYTCAQISPVVGAHVGPGATAFFYVATNEVDKDLEKKK